MDYKLRLLNTDVGRRFIYFTIGGGVVEHHVSHDREKDLWRCTCAHGSVFRFRKNNPGVCKHIKFCEELLNNNDFCEEQGLKGD